MSANTPAKKIASSDKPQDRKEQILDAALELFTKQGYEGTSIDNIREKSGFNSKASLYTHFKSKEEISEALTTRILAKIQTLVIDADAEPDGDPLWRFTTVFRAYIHWGLTHREEFVFRIIRAQELRMLIDKYDFQLNSQLHTTSLYLRFIDILESLRDRQYPVRSIENAALFHMTIGAICRAAIDDTSFYPVKDGTPLDRSTLSAADIAAQVEQILEVCIGIVFTHTPVG
jgi:AcrR family transcriptional regulator